MHAFHVLHNALKNCPLKIVELRVKTACNRHASAGTQAAENVSKCKYLVLIGDHGRFCSEDEDDNGDAGGGGKHNDETMTTRLSQRVQSEPTCKSWTHSDDPHTRCSGHAPAVVQHWCNSVMKGPQVKPDLKRRVRAQNETDKQLNAVLEPAALEAAYTGDIGAG